MTIIKLKQPVRLHVKQIYKSLPEYIFGYDPHHSGYYRNGYRTDVFYDRLSSQRNVAKRITWRHKYERKTRKELISIIFRGESQRGYTEIETDATPQQLAKLFARLPDNISSQLIGVLKNTALQIPELSVEEKAAIQNEIKADENAWKADEEWREKKRLGDAYQVWTGKQLSLDDNKWRTIDRFVKKPLGYTIETIKIAFAYTIGFEWFINLTRNLNLPTATLILPSIPKISFYGRTIIEPTKNILRINPVNFWAQFLNYFARNLGKLIGWIIVAPFAMPALGIIELIYGIKKTLLTESPIKDNVELQLKLKNDDKKIAEHANTTDFSLSLVELESNRTLKVISSDFDKASYYKQQPKYLYHFEAFADARNKVLNKQRTWEILKTVLSGILIVPLFFTIPALKKTLSLQSDERLLLTHNAAIFNDVNKQWREEYPAERSSIFFEIGKKFRNAGNMDLAFIWFSKTPSTSSKYQDAMFECANILFNEGEFLLAKDYFNKAEHSQGVDLATNLANGFPGSKELVKHLSETVKTGKPVETQLYGRNAVPTLFAKANSNDAKDAKDDKEILNKTPSPTSRKP